MPGKQKNEQGFRQGRRGDMNFGRGGRRNRFNGFCGWNQENDQCRKNRRRGARLNKTNENKQPETAPES